MSRIASQVAFAHFGRLSRDGTVVECCGRAMPRGEHVEHVAAVAEAATRAELEGAGA